MMMIVDGLARDAFANIDGQSVTACINAVPTGVVFVHWVSAVTILSRRTGTPIVDLLPLLLHVDQTGGCFSCAGGEGDHHSSGCSWSYKIDDGDGDSRTLELKIASNDDDGTSVGIKILQTATASPEIEERDRLFRNVLAETAEENRGSLMSVCLSACPEKMAFVDFVFLVSILAKVGIINLEGDNGNNDNGEEIMRTIESDSWGDGVYYYGVAWYCEVGTDGLIKRLSVGGDGANEPLEIDDIAPYDLPADVSRLRKLQILDVVGNCRSLPVAALSDLPHLHMLSLTRCSNLLMNFPLTMALPCVRTLGVDFYYDSEDDSEGGRSEEGRRFGDRSEGSRLESASRFIQWAASQLPVLESLHFSCLEEAETNCVINALRALDFCCFKNSLKNIDFTGCDLTDDHFASLLVNTLQKFPSVSHLDLRYNNIRSTRSIVRRIENSGDGFLLSKSIHTLSLYGNPILRNANEDPKEKGALLSFLKIFNTIWSLGHYQVNRKLASEVRYALRINQAGRSVIEGRRGRGGTNWSPLPLSVWPTVLERSYEKSFELFDVRKQQKNATGMFYLLREGPVLIGRSA